MRLNIRDRKLRFAALAVAAILLLNGAIYYWGSSFRTWSGSLNVRPDFVAILAVLYGQFALVAAWACLTRAPFLLRPASVVLAFWFAKFMVLHFGRDTDEGATFRLLFLAASILIVFIVGRIFVLRIEHTTKSRTDTRRAIWEIQFSLNDMLLLTAVAATIFTIMRLTREAAFAPLSAITLVAAWAVLATQHVWARLAALAVVTSLIGLGLHLVFWGGIRTSDLPCELLFTGTFALVLVGGFIGFRISGYRLVRRSRPPSPGAAQVV